MALSRARISIVSIAGARSSFSTGLKIRDSGCEPEASLRGGRAESSLSPVRRSRNALQGFMTALAGLPVRKPGSRDYLTQGILTAIPTRR